MTDYAVLAGLIIGAAVTAGTPVLFAVTGETLSQRTGVVNLGLEGAMLMGAVLAAWAYKLTGSVMIAVLAGAAAGGLLGLAHAFLVTLASIGMFASGICLFFVGRGLSAFWGYPIVGEQFPGLPRLKIPVLSDIPIIGEAFFSQDLLVYLAAAVAFGAWYLLFKTRWGLMIRAIGEDANVSRAEGIPVTRIRIACITIGSALAGIGGAHIVLAFSHTWLEGLTAGRGWIALGLVVLARWNPLYAILVTYLFGSVIAIQFNAQAAGISVSPYLLSMLPYILTVIALVVADLWKRGSEMPAELKRTAA
jgi:general nucleoside transport system permease protein